jgi:hypothetical protein
MRFSAVAPCLVILGIATTSSLADAGYYQNNVVTVTSSYALGSVGAARHSSDSTQYIACETFASSGYPDEVYCYANDATNKYLSCASLDANLIAVGGRVNSASAIYFSTDGAGTCTGIYVTNGSQQLYY